MTMVRAKNGHLVAALGIAAAVWMSQPASGAAPFNSPASGRVPDGLHHTLFNGPVARWPSQPPWQRHVRGSQPVNRTPRELLGEAIDQFERAQVVESAATFDRLAAAAPDVMPNLWQRGIAQYYAGRYRDCRLQFEAHRTVNPDDVENAAWHFLCAAREATAARARTTLLPVGPDSRVPMKQIYDLFAGKTTPETVIAAGRGTPGAEFFANLYTGLYHEALGNAERSLAHVTVAAEPRFEEAGDYMHMVARVHLVLRGRQLRPR